MATKDIAVFVGSLRKEAFSLKLAKALQKLSPEGLKLDIVEIGHLGFYNQDLDANPPAIWTDFRERVRRADGVLLITPEYNRSVPAVLKNALDVGSRPYGKSAWTGKPGGVLSITPGPLGAFGANHHLRQSLVFLNVLPLQQPEVYLSGADKMFDAAGELTTASTKEFLTTFLQAYSAWVTKIGG
jgi:chromate reductase